MNFVGVDHESRAATTRKLRIGAGVTVAQFVDEGDVGVGPLGGSAAADGIEGIARVAHATNVAFRCWLALRNIEAVGVHVRKSNSQWVGSDPMEPVVRR